MKRVHYLVLSVLPFLVGMTGIITLHNGPYTGLVFSASDGQWVIEETVPGSPGDGLDDIKGWRIISLGGFELGPYDFFEDYDYMPDRESLLHWWSAQRHFSKIVRPGKKITLTIGRNGMQKEVVLTPSAMGPGRIAGGAGMMFFIGLFSLVVGLCVVYRKPGDTRAKVFYFMMFSVAMIFVTFGSYTSRDIAFNYAVFSLFIGINMITFGYFPVFFLQFCLVFPREKKLAKQRLFIAVLYALPVVVNILHQPRIFYMLQSLFCMAGLLSGILSMAHSYFTAGSALEKSQIRWIIWGVGIFVSVFMVTTFLPIIFQGQRLFGDRVPSFFFIFVPLSMAFAITRYHLLDIDTIFDTTIIYFITLGVIAILDIGVISGIARLKESAFPIDEPFSTVLALWFAVLAYVPVRNGINGVIKRILRRDVYNPQELHMLLGATLLKARSSKMALGHAVDLLYTTFRPLGIQAHLFHGGEWVSCNGVKQQRGEVPSFFDPFACARDHERPVPVFMLTDTSDPPPEYRDGVIVPMHASTGAIGCMLLKNRSNGRLYSTNDLNFMNTVANQAAMAAESFMRKEESEAKERERLKERERISREIHDGIGSTFSSSIMLADLLGSRHEPGDAKRLSQLRGLLKTGLGDLRDFIRTVEEHDAKVEDMIPLINEKASQILGDRIAFTLDYNAGDMGRSLSSMQRLNIIRILQEALTNCAKHSRAEKVVIDINCSKTVFRLSITDNGCGFDVKQSAGDGYGLRNIYKRCEEMGAECVFGSGPMRGTSLVISIQLSPVSPDIVLAEA